MTKRWLTNAVILLVSLIALEVLMPPSRVNAQCSVTCFMTCGNCCEAEFSGCGLLEWIAKVQKCCADARRVTPDTGECTGS